MTSGLAVRVGTRSEEWPALAAMVAVGVALGGLLCGLGPTGNDPDLLYRPLKQLLIESLAAGWPPYWTDRLGLGIPLVGESHVAAFYPPNLLLYPAFGLGLAYRLAMWLHHVFLASTTYFYARTLDICPWGAALSSVSFSLCGFLAAHSVHEPFYTAMPYLPLALGLTEASLKAGGRRRLAALSITLGVQLLVGHFQIQYWTMGLVAFTGTWRVLCDRLPWRRLAGLALAMGGALAIAAVQVKPTLDLLRLTGQARRALWELFYFPFPPLNYAELAFPWVFRGLPGGEYGPYWRIESQRTSGTEACFYVGTVGLILAAAGALAPSRRRVMPWLALIPASAFLATLPLITNRGFALVASLPGFGLFRCPARYLVIASLGMAVLAGRGLDRSIPAATFRTSVRGAVGFGAVAGFACLACACWLDDADRFGSGTLPIRFGYGLAGWTAALVAVGLWRTGRAGAWLPFVVAAAELGLLFPYTTGRWVRDHDLPAESPVLARLAGTPGARRVQGWLDNLPVRAGLAAASPYTGAKLPPPYPILVAAANRHSRHWDPKVHLPWLRRFGMTHAVFRKPVPTYPGERLETMIDPVLDVAAVPGWFYNVTEPRTYGEPYQVVTLAEPLPDARVALRSRTVASAADLFRGKSGSTDEGEAWYVQGEAPPSSRGTQARSARVISWDGRSALVEHDGVCDLVLARAHDPGWRARIDDGPEGPVYPVDGGIQAIRLEGSGTTRVSLRYAPTGQRAAEVLSLVASLSALIVLLLPDRGRPVSWKSEEPA